jgi:hypothetical protein
MITGPAVPKIFWQPPNTVLASSANWALRWSITGMSMARSTRSGTGLGPGICKKWRPWCSVMASSSDLAANHIAFNFSTYNQQIVYIF